MLTITSAHECALHMARVNSLPTIRNSKEEAKTLYYGILHSIKFPLWAYGSS